MRATITHGRQPTGGAKRHHWQQPDCFFIVINNGNSVEQAPESRSWAESIDDNAAKSGTTSGYGPAIDLNRGSSFAVSAAPNCPCGLDGGNRSIISQLRMRILA